MAGRIVPLMFFIYMIMALIVLATHYEQIPHAFLLIFKGAFSPEAGYGGFIGVLVTGLQRAAFSNEAGLGSSPIVHSAARVSHPIEEGAVALLELFWIQLSFVQPQLLLSLLLGFMTILSMRIGSSAKRCGAHFPGFISSP